MRLKWIARELIRRSGIDGRPSALAQRLAARGLTYLPPRKLVRIERCFHELVRDGVEGDYLEFGVAAGGSAILIAKEAQRRGARFLGFDVFDQIPEPTSEHDDEKSRNRYQTIAEGKARGLGGQQYYGYVDDLYDQVVRAMAEYGLECGSDDILLCRGLFEDTLPQVDVPRIAFAHIDCDWYDPVRTCLEFVAPRLAKGGRVVIDDYHYYSGCRRATDEFLAENVDFRLLKGRNPILIKGDPAP